jgi:hypothetical protein
MIAAQKFRVALCDTPASEQAESDHGKPCSNSRQNRR